MVFFSTWKILFYLSIVWRLLLINLFSFCMYHDVFISHSDLKGIFTGNRILTWNFSRLWRCYSTLWRPPLCCLKFYLLRVFLNHILESYFYYMPWSSFTFLKDDRDSCICGFYDFSSNLGKVSIILSTFFNHSKFRNSIYIYISHLNIVYSSWMALPSFLALTLDSFNFCVY